MHHHSWLNDVLRPWRARRSHGLFAGVILALGAAAVMSSLELIHRVVLPSSPFQSGEALAVTRWIQVPFRDVVPPRYSLTLDEVRQLTAFDRVELFAVGEVTLVTPSQKARRVIAEVTAGTLPLLGVHPVLGRGITETDALDGAPPVVLLSHRLWHELFTGDRGALGRTIEINSVAHQIIGVLPRGFNYPENTHLWRPLVLPFRSTNDAYLGAVAQTALLRVASHVNVAAARSDLEARIREAARLVGRQFPDTAQLVQVVKAEVFGANRSAVLYLFAGVGVLLVIAVSNVASMYVVASSRRRGEFAIRSALGASRSALIRQLVTEAMAVVIPAFAAGVIVAVMVRDPLTRLVAPVASTLGDYETEPTVLLAMFAVTAVIVAVLAIVPYSEFVARGNDVTIAGTPRTTTGYLHRAHRLAVVVQLAGAYALTAVALGLEQRVSEIDSTETGLRLHGVRATSLFTDNTRHPTIETRRAFYRNVLATLNTAGTQGAMINAVPFSGQRFFRVNALPENARDPGGFDEALAATFIQVTPDYFAVVGVPVLSGRTFAREEDDTSAAVVIVNETLARSYWPSGPAIGKRLRIAGRWRVVVGVVGDSRLRGADHPSGKQAYLPFMQFAPRRAALVARTNGSGEPKLVSMVEQVDPGQPRGEEPSLSQLFVDSSRHHRVRAGVAFVLTALAGMLALAGVYSTIATSIAESTNDIALRRALGATTWQIIVGLSRSVALYSVLAFCAVATAWFLADAASVVAFPKGIDTWAFLKATVWGLAAVSLATAAALREAIGIEPARMLKN